MSIEDDRNILVNFNLSQPQHTPEGNGLMHLYYDTDLRYLLDNGSGYPHNGGEHTLHTQISIPDLKDWLEVVLDEMGPVAAAFVDAVNLKITTYLEKCNEINNG